MPSLKDVKIGGQFKAMFVGNNGAGKTIAAASFYKRHMPKKIWFADFDGRMKPLQLAIRENWLPKEAEDYIIYDTFGPSTYPMFQAKWNQYIADPNIGMIVMDSFTSLTVTCVLWQMKSKGLEAKMTKAGLVVPGFDEIHGEANEVSRILDDMKSSSKDHIWNCHPIEKLEGNVKAKSIAAFGWKIPKLVPNYFDEIYFFESEFPGGILSRVVKTIPDSIDFAKTALPLDNKYVVTGKSFFEYLKNNLKLKGVEF